MKSSLNFANSKFQNYLPFCLGGAILAYLIARVIIVPATVDEYLSLTYFVDKTWLDVLTSYHVDITHSSNNHVLNSIFMKIAISIFGEYDWAIRLHILAAFVVCYFFVWKIFSLFNIPPVRLTAYLMLVFLNPYLLDFFAIARGYAPSMAGWSAATYFFILYCNEPKTRHLTNTMIWLFVAVYSSFSALYFAIIFGAGMVFLLVKNRKSDFFAKHIAILVLGTIIIAAINGLSLYRTIIGNSAHGGVNSFFSDSIVSYAVSAIHYNPHIGVRRKLIFELMKVEVYSVLLVAAWLAALVFSFKLPRTRLLAIAQHTLAVQCISIALLCTVFFKLMATPYPLTRTTLLFSLPFILFFLLALEQAIHNIRNTQIILWPIVAAVLWHFMVCFNFDNTFEWQNEGDAKHVLSYMAKLNSGQKGLTLGVENWRYPSIAFYERTKYKGLVNLDWSAIEKPIDFDFIYVPKNMEQDLQPEFVREKEFKHGFILKKVRQDSN